MISLAITLTHLSFERSFHPLPDDSPPFVRICGAEKEPIAIDLIAAQVGGSDKVRPQFTFVSPIGADAEGGQRSRTFQPKMAE
jgi:hypothetical protein